MNETDFLQQLKKEAKAQAPLESAHLLPSRFRQLSAWFWQHPWQVWSACALLSALIFEFWQGRCLL